MNLQTAISMLQSARNGAEMLEVLDTLMTNTAGYEYIESPQIAKVLGVPTLEPMEF
jgi:hypothetical protein